jgi:hypothetical protein
MDFEIIIPSNRPALRREAQLCVRNHNNRIFDGTHYPSFSKLINDCILTSSYETIAICNDKARPKDHQVIKMINLLHEGWGLVCLYRFGFFGFKKDLIRKIGFFDERYLGGGYDDADFLRRLKEADIAYYESEEIDYIQLPTSWNYDKDNIALAHFLKKWRHEGNIIIRQMAEENYGYDIGPFQNTKFIEFEKTVVIPLPDNFGFKNMVMQTDLIY